MLAAQMPAVNGVFTARALATMYGALANGGTVDDVELLSRRTVHEAGRVQTRGRLVEKHEHRVMHERLAQLHALLHARRIAADRAVSLLARTKYQDGSLLVYG